MKWITIQAHSAVCPSDLRVRSQPVRLGRMGPFINGRTTGYHPSLPLSLDHEEEIQRARCKLVVFPNIRKRIRAHAEIVREFILVVVVLIGTYTLG